MFSNWIALSVTSMLWIAPAWMGTTFFQQHFGVRPEVYLIYYFTGVILYAGPWAAAQGASFVPGLLAAALMIGVGFISGGPANTMLFRAVAIAPNQGLPIAIVTMSSIVVFAATLWMGRFMPQYFPQVAFNGYHFAGALLAVASVAVFSLAPGK